MISNIKFESYKDKNNNTLWLWRGYDGVNPHTNKPINTRRIGFKTKKEAQENYLEFHNNIFHRKIMDSKITIEELMQSYFEFKRDKVKTATLSTYANALKAMYNHGVYMPGVKICDVNVMMCNQIYNRIKKHYKRPVYYLNIFKTIFEYACKMELLESNPFKKVDTTTVQKKKENSILTFTVEELRDFIEGSKQLKNYQYYYMFSLLAKTGMRQGEVRALYWSDIDFKNKTINIDKTVTKDMNNKEYIGDTPKSRESERVIKIDDNLCSLLYEYRKRDFQDQFKLGRAVRDGLVFHSFDGSIISAPQTRKAMELSCANAGVPYITLHGLRHTFITLAVESGLQPIDIAKVVGHGDINMIVKIYDHLTDARKENIMNTMSNYVGNF